MEVPNHSQTGLHFLYFGRIKVVDLYFIYFDFSADYLIFFLYQIPQSYPVPGWQSKRSSNILERLSLDFFFPKGQDFIHLAVALGRTWTFQRDGIILLQFPISSLSGFLCNFVIEFFGLTKAKRWTRGGKGKKKLTQKKENINHTAQEFPKWESSVRFRGFLLAWVWGIFFFKMFYC